MTHLRLLLLLSLAFVAVVFDASAFAQIPTNGISHVLVPNSQQAFYVPYSIMGGLVGGITTDPQSISLIVPIISNYGGSMTIQIPRELLDAKTNSGSDEPFIVLENVAQLQVYEIRKDSTSRTLYVPFQGGVSQIEIIGTIFSSQYSSQTPSQANITQVEQLMNTEYQNPTDIGLVANGLINYTGNMNTYEINADKIMAYVHVNSLDAVSPPNSGASLQLNIILHVVASNSAHDLWLQNVIQFLDTQKKTYRIVDNIWNADSKDNLQQCVFGICRPTNAYVKLPFLQLVHPYKYTLPFSESLMISEQPIIGKGVQVTFLYVGNGLVHVYDKKLIEIPGLKSASFSIEPNMLTGYGVANDAELVWGGVCCGSSAHFSSLDSQLALEYANGDYSWKPFPYYFTKSLDTGESAQNLISTVVQSNYGFVTSTSP